MITSRRDYLLRLIDEVSRLLARVLLKRKEGQVQESLHTIVEATERLFARPAHELFPLPPDHQYLMLTQAEEPDAARAKVLIYAALNAEAGRCYTDLRRPELARASYLHALRITCRARLEYPTSDPLPDYAPSIPDLLSLLGDAPLDPETAKWVKDATK